MTVSLMLLRVALVAAASTRAASLAPKPNFVMLLADDWGWGDYYADVGGTGVEPNQQIRTKALNMFSYCRT